MCIILPAKGNLAVGKVCDPVIGNGDAMRVAGQLNDVHPVLRLSYETLKRLNSLALARVSKLDPLREIGLQGEGRKPLLALIFASRLYLQDSGASIRKELSMEPKDENKVAAAQARAASLTKTERSAIARKAALVRHGKDLPRAVAEGFLQVGDVRLACAVLDDQANTRVFTQEGFLNAIGRAGKAKGGEGASVDGRPAFLRAKNLEPFISDELIASTTPLEFIPEKGPGYQGRAFGYKASLLPAVCWVYQDALVANALLPSQQHISEQCKILLKALTNYAIEDLIDRATGFEDFRKRNAVLKIIERYVRRDALPWVKMFDGEFYKQIYRLNGWPFDPERTAKPGVIGHWTNDIYDRLAPGVRPALHSRVRRNEAGKPTQKLTQYLTPEEGKPRLRELLEGVKALMRVSKNWPEFKVKLDMVYPNWNSNLQLPFDEELTVLSKPSMQTLPPAQHSESDVSSTETLR